jgi:nucleotide-binding universal stress UspA family protein
MQRFKNILFFLGKSDLSGTAAKSALHLARSNRARLTVFDVVNVDGGGYRFGSSSAKLHEIEQMLILERHKEIERILSDTDLDVEVDIQVFAGKTFIEVIRYVQREKIDLVIKEVEEDKRFAAMFFGSTDLRLLRKCPCPVWLVNPEAVPGKLKILAAIELEAIDDEGQLNDLNQKIIEIASSLAFQEDSELHIVNAWIVFEGGRLAKKLSKQYREDIAVWVDEQKVSIAKAQSEFQKAFNEQLQQRGLQDLAYTFHFPEGIAEEVIVDLADRLDIDLVVMGTVARTDLAGLLVGNTSEEILSKISCSVLAIKPPGFVSPVTDENR